MKEIESDCTIFTLRFLIDSTGEYGASSLCVIKGNCNYSVTYKVSGLSWTHVTPTGVEGTDVKREYQSEMHR
jgi:hypothetical protein